jgi:hypothetical protein
MTFKKYILTTPRVGGTAYGKLLGEENNVKFFNEPFAQYTVYSKKANVIVGNIQLAEYLITDNFVVHTHVSQFMDYFNTVDQPSAEDIIFLERRDKWAQLLSYLKAFSIYFSSFSDHEFHNLNYSENRTIDVDNKLFNIVSNEWAIYSLLKERYNNSEVIYYEDIHFPENFSLQKNKGLDRITILNIESIARRFEFIWKYYPL